VLYRDDSRSLEKRRQRKKRKGKPNIQIKRQGLLCWDQAVNGGCASSALRTVLAWNYGMEKRCLGLCWCWCWDVVEGASGVVGLRAGGAVDVRGLVGAVRLMERGSCSGVRLVVDVS
jgi:hypothetical protein